MLKDDITRMWGMKEVLVISVVLGVLGAISTGFEKYIAAIGIEMRVEHAQKNSFVGDSKYFDTGTRKKKKKKNIISVIVQDSVRSLTTGCCSL